jgi:hypothetical protein
LVLLGGQPDIMGRGVDDLVSRVPGVAAPGTASQRTTIGAIPVIQRSVVSSARVEDLKAYFKDAFEKAGMHLAPIAEKFKPQVGEQVSGLDTENMISYTVFFQPSGKYTTVVIGAADLGHPKASKGNEAIGPVYPGATKLTSYNLEQVRGMTYICSGTPAEIKAFYRDEFAKLGYKETDELVFIKDTSRAWITVAPGLSERGVAVYLQNGGAQPGVPNAVAADIQKQIEAAGVAKEPKPAPAPAPAPKK